MSDIACNGIFIYYEFHFIRRLSRILEVSTYSIFNLSIELEVQTTNWK